MRPASFSVSSKLFEPDGDGEERPSSAEQKQIKVEGFFLFVFLFL